MNYIVDREKRNALIKEMRKKQGIFVGFLHTIWRISIGICVFIFLGCTAFGINRFIINYAEGYYFEAWVYALGFMLIGSIAMLVFSFIPLFINFFINTKFLRPWTKYTNEYLELHSQSMEWGRTVLTFWSSNYWIAQMKYSDILKIEFDKEQKLLRIYGSRTEKIYEDEEKGKRLDTFKTQEKHGEKVWMTICSYYKDFDKLVEELEKLSGKKVIEFNRDFNFRKSNISIVE